MLTLRTPEPDEAGRLTELCLRSKAAWGYDEAFLEACRAELTLTPSALRHSHMKVADRDGTLVGMAQVTVEGEVAALEKLFVEPTRLHGGCGRALLEWAKDTARALGAAILVIESDPGAAEFYRRMGAVDDGSVPSGSIPGRLIPRLTIAL